MDRLFLLGLLILVVQAAKSPSSLAESTISKSSSLSQRFIDETMRKSNWQQLSEAGQFIYDVMFFGTSKILSPNTLKRDSNDEYLSDEPISSQEFHEKQQYRKQKSRTNKKQSSTPGGPCNWGIQVFNATKQDTCQARYCRINEVNCSGVLYTDFNEFSGQVSMDCTVTAITCSHDIQNMKERYNATNCNIEKLSCHGYDTDLYDVKNDGIGSCSVQLFCDDWKRYGYDEFGFYCEQQQLQCGGVVISPEQVQNETFANLLTDCHVNRFPCTTLSDNTTCGNYDIECQAEVVDGCTFAKLKSDCGSESDPQCEITEMICGGETITDTTGYSAQDVQNCTVQRVTCRSSGNTFDQGNFGSECHLRELICDGVIADASVYTGNISGCFLSEVQCGSDSNCNIYQFGCTNSGDCHVAYTEPLCKNPQACQQLLNTSSCVCPIDKIGADCSLQRPMHCAYNLEYPALNCSNGLYEDKSDPKEALLDGDRACLIFGLDEPATLKYRLHCAFKTPVGTIPPEVLNANFSYFISNDNFSLTEEQYWQVLMKIYNFNMLSDNGATDLVNLTTAQMQGIDPIWFNTTALKDIKSQYWHGYRLYSEWKWADVRPNVDANAKTLARQFIDSPEYRLAHPVSYKASNKTKLILGSVFGTIGGVIVITLLVIFRKKVKMMLGYQQDFDE